MASICRGASPVARPAGRRMTGFSQPIAPGTLTSADSSTRTGLETPTRRASRATFAARSVPGGAVASRLSRPAAIHPPNCRSDSRHTPAAQARTSHGMAGSTAATRRDVRGGLAGSTARTGAGGADGTA